MSGRYLRSFVIAQVVLAALVVLPVSAGAQTPAPDPSDAFFNNAIVQDVYFTINSKDWNTLKVNYLDNTYYPVDFKWGTTIVRNAGIRSRGTGSRSDTKPGLRLDFNRYTAGQDFLGMKAVVIRNGTQDPTNMHETVGMLLFKKLGLTAPREAFARLFINNAYEGLFSIVDNIDKTFLAKNFRDDKGFLFKYDYNVGDLPYFFTYRTSNPADYVPSPFKPETNSSDPQPEVFERFAWTINNATDAAFRTAIAEFVDLTDFVKHVASEVYIADSDGFLGNFGMNNYYLYRLDDSHQFHFIDWDKSEAFKDTPDYPIWHNHLDHPPDTQNRLFARTMALPDMKKLFLDTLVQCADIATAIPDGSAPGETRGWMLQEFDRELGLITAPVLADPTKSFTNTDFQTAAAFMRDFVQRRPAIVRTQVAASP